MMKNTARAFLALTISEGIAALIWLVRVRAGNARLLGLSTGQAVAAALALLALAVLAAGLALTFRSGWFERWRERLGRALAPARMFWLCAGLLFSAGLCLLAGLFTLLVIPPYLVGIIAWAGLSALQGLLLLRLLSPGAFSQPEFWSPLADLPRWSRLDAGQHRVFWLLTLVGLLYFLAFCIPNAQHAHTPEEIIQSGGDEWVTYGPATLMLAPAKTPAEAVYHFFIYEDYHYGYPFYFLSMLALLPVRVIAGAGFAALTQVNLLLLRQWINVLPMLLAALVLTCLQTRLRGWKASLGLFLFLLFIPQVVSYNIQFWHPDALVALAAALALFFLDRDRLRFGLSFNLAAVFAGLAAAIKLFGFFFFLAVGGCLLAGWLLHRINWRQMLGRGAIFIAVMAATIALANPFLLVPQARQRMVAIMVQKSGEVTGGYHEPGSEAYYQRGIAANLGFLEYHGRYGSRWLLGFLALSLAAAALWGPQRTAARLILAWFTPQAVYFFFLVSYKSFHYWLPAMLPFFSGALGLAQAGERLPLRWARWTGWLVAAALLVQFALNLSAAGQDWQQWLK